jgi:hypothetical protein
MVASGYAAFAASLSVIKAIGILTEQTTQTAPLSELASNRLAPADELSLGPDNSIPEIRTQLARQKWDPARPHVVVQHL